MLIKKDFIEFGRGKDKRPRKKRSIGKILRRSAYALAGGALLGAAAVPVVKRQQAINTIKAARKVHSSGTKDVALGKSMTRSFGKSAASRDLGPGREALETIASRGSNVAKEGKEKQQVAREAIAELRKQYPKKPRKK